MRKFLLSFFLFVSIACDAQTVNILNPYRGEPPSPPQYPVSAFSLDGTGSAAVATRQADLEPSVSGVDHAFSFACWVRVSNVGTAAQTVFGVTNPTTGAAQWSLFMRSQTETAATNQHIQFSLVNGANFIRVLSTNIFLKNRWVHVVGTYDGSETSAGLDLYFNGVHDATATKDGGGTYTGALNSADLRMQIARVVATQHFRGNLKDLHIYHIKLNQTQVTEAFNGGVPKDPTTLSFYAGNIKAYWPLASDVTCTNSSTFNFSGAVGITFSNRSVSPTFEGISFMNSAQGSARYRAFATPIKRASSVDIYFRDGDNHLDNGFINRVSFTPGGINASSPPTSFSGNIISNSPRDLRGLYTGVIGGNIVGFTSDYNDATTSFVSVGRYESTDGTTGLTFGSYTNMQSAAVGQSINAYGKIVEGNNPGEYLIAIHEYTVPSQSVYIWRWNGSWVKDSTPMLTGTSGDGWNEVCLQKTPLGHVALARAQAGAMIACLTSTDNAVTWSSPVNSGLSTGTGMADMTINPNGQIVAVVADRGDGYLKVSDKNNVAAIFADPSDWNPASGIWRTIGDGTNLLGYPTITDFGWYYVISVSSEDTGCGSPCTDADLFVGYGLFGGGWIIIILRRRKKEDSNFIKNTFKQAA